MAKNESTAVNELIRIATTQKPLQADPADDLMFTDPPTPLPRSRAANGTPLGTMTMQGLGTPPMAPAPPQQPDQPMGAMTIQGLGPVVQRAMAAAAAPRSVDDERGGEPAAATPAAPLPAPARSQPMSALPLPAPAQSQPMPAQSLPLSPPPRAMPVAAPFETGSMPLVAQVVSPAAPAVHPAERRGHEQGPSRAWFEQAHERLDHRAHVSPSEAWIGTMQLRRGSRSLVRKLLVQGLTLCVYSYVIYPSMPAPACPDVYRE
jgi:hypothetical protein